MQTRLVFLALLLVSEVIGRAGQVSHGLICEEEWSNVFAEDPVTLHFRATNVLDPAAWRLSTGGRTVARGEASAGQNAAGEGRYTIRLQMPPVKPGVVLRTVLDVSARAATGLGVVNTTKVLWVFHRDAFTDHMEWMDGLALRLFDPDGTTTACFEDDKIPFEAIHNADELLTVTNGIVVVGEGISFAEWRGLPRLLVTAVRRNVNVLCLAPAGGDLVLPVVHDIDMPKPRRWSVAGTEVIKRFDKRFDDTAWSPGGRMGLSAFTLQARTDLVAAFDAEGRGDWTWIELDYRPDGGRLIVCGFGLIANWTESPVPRYLLLEILDRLRETKISVGED